MYWPLNVPRVYTSKLPQHALDDFVRETVPASPLAFTANTPRTPANPGQDDDIGEPYVGDTPNPLETVPEIPDLEPVGHTTVNREESMEEVDEEADEEAVLVERYEKSSVGDWEERHADPSKLPNRDVLAIKISRSGSLFATISSAELVIWQTRFPMSSSLLPLSPKSYVLHRLLNFTGRTSMS